MKTALITGATGMAGSYLIEHILESQPGWEIIACRRRHSDMSNVSHIRSKRLIWAQVDLIDSYEVGELVKRYQPDKVFHLAAQSFVPRSWQAPGETIDVNLKGTLNLLQGLRPYPETIIHLAGSSEQYGMVYGNEIPITEANMLRPLSPYAITKIAMENLAYCFWKSYGMKVILTRAFNHTGPRRGEEFVCPQICKQAAEIKGGARKCFRLGNLDAVRDFTDVRDMVAAYWLATESHYCEFGSPYNICSGMGYSIKDILLQVAKLAGVPQMVEADVSKLRPADVPVLIGNCDRFRHATGWRPKRNFLEQTLYDIYKAWKKGGEINGG